MTSNTTTLEVVVIPVWEDNYTYIVAAGHTCLAIDPACAETVSRAAQTRGKQVTHIVVTHQHADHTAGVAELVRAHGCPVLSPDDSLSDPPEIAITPIQTPGHTPDHVAYYLPDANAVFTGDALFVYGCGRVAGGQYAQMWHSLEALARLPDETRVFCGHNYTVENLEFLLHVAPHATGAAAALEQAREKHAAREPSVPSTIAEEKRLNPFLRCGDPAFADELGLSGQSPEAVFEHLRRRKDRW